jgi:hypothetical protein
MVEPYQPPLRVDHHADGVEAQLPGVRALGSLDQPGGRHASYLRPLGRRQGVPGMTGAVAAGLDLAEDDRRGVGDHEVDLAEAGPVTPGEDAVAEPLEVLGGESLTLATEVLAQVCAHGRRRYGRPRDRSARERHGFVAESAEIRYSASCWYATD